MLFSRRQFVAFAAAGCVPGLRVGAQPSQQTSITAQQLIDRIKANLGAVWRDKTIDGFKAGDPATVVTGVVTTVSATLPVLQRAVAAGHNLVITQEPVFYSLNDEPGNRAADPVLLAKKAHIEQKGLVVFRLSDHWTARQPNPMAPALAETLGWTEHRAAGADDIYNIPPTTLGALQTYIRTRLAVRGGLRSVGPASMPVRTVLISPATTDLPSTVARLSRADVIIAGEPREWEAVPYVLDMRSAGHSKGMIALGRLLSEEPGMRACATWIKSFVPELRVESITVGDPYWSPVP
jgi:NIF3 (NGG1p interacting factor 3)